MPMHNEVNVISKNDAMDTHQLSELAGSGNGRC
jgi:hypothetical protein